MSLFDDENLFEEVAVKRGSEDEPVIGRVLVYEEDGQIGAVVPDGARIRFDSE